MAAPPGPRMTAKEREREAAEAAARRRLLSRRVGGLGVVFLFLGGGATVAYPAGVGAFLVLMVVGIVLVAGALLLVMGSLSGVTKVT